MAVVSEKGRRIDDKFKRLQESVLGRKEFTRSYSSHRVPNVPKHVPHVPKCVPDVPDVPQRVPKAT